MFGLIGTVVRFCLVAVEFGYFKKRTAEMAFRSSIREVRDMIFIQFFMQ